MTIVDPAEVLDDISEVAKNVLEWKATTEQWIEIARCVEAAVTAWRARDWLALRQATTDLELASPWRTTDMGDERRVQSAVPEDVKERANMLVRARDDNREPEPEQPAKGR